MKIGSARNIKARIGLLWRALNLRCDPERIELAGRILERCLSETGSAVNGEFPEYLTNPWPSDRPNLANARCEVIDFYELSRTHLRAAGITGGAMAEIGGSVSANAHAAFRELEYTNIDLRNSETVPTIVMDVCEPVAVEYEERFDFILSHWVFEHLAAPWVTAQNIVKMLKPGGLCVTVTIFAWRYHPVPEDYWRYTPQALSYIFKELKTIDAAFVPVNRRANTAGFYPNGADRVPVDAYGGWLENWAVYHVGRKAS